MAVRLLELVRSAFRQTRVGPESSITFLSYPRSGHHWLTGLAADYCGKFYGCVPQIEYKKRRKSDAARGDTEAFIRAGRFTYCEYYGHCLMRPCPDGALVQKNHDFNLFLRYRESDRYIVLIRDPLISITAFYDYKRRSQPWADFSAASAKHWTGFVDKWVLPQYGNVLTLAYEDLAADPNSTLSRFLSYCGIPVHEELLTYGRSTTARMRVLDPALDYSIARGVIGRKYSEIISVLGSRRSVSDESNRTRGMTR